MDQQNSVRPNGPSIRPKGDRGDGHRDLTKGPILSTLLVFSAPTLASNILQAMSGSVSVMGIDPWRDR